jgi:hypothetical protein
LVHITGAIGAGIRRKHFREGTVKLPRRQFLHLAAGAAALPSASRIARAQTYPARPVRLIVPGQQKTANSYFRFGQQRTWAKL